MVGTLGSKSEGTAPERNQQINWLPSVFIPDPATKFVAESRAVSGVGYFVVEEFTLKCNSGDALFHRFPQGNIEVGDRIETIALVVNDQDATGIFMLSKNGSRDEPKCQAQQDHKSQQR
jgi:hypothetical protein